MLVLILAAQLAGPPAAIGQMAWLRGCWIQQGPNGTVEELWMAPGGGVMLGLSRTVRDGKLRDYEYARIAETGGSLTFIAKPLEQAEATFPLKAMTATTATFENPAHDFPQRVIYRQAGPGAIAARIEGQIGGQAKSVDFAYKRCPTGD